MHLPHIEQCLPYCGLEKEVSVWSYWPVEGFGAVGKTWGPDSRPRVSLPKAREMQTLHFPNWQSGRCTQYWTAEVCASQNFKQRHWAKNLLVFILAKPLAKNGWLPSNSLGMDGKYRLPWKPAAGFLWDCFEKWFSLINLTNIICHHSFLPIHSHHV